MQADVRARLAAIRKRENKATPGPWHDTDQEDGVLRIAFGPLNADGTVNTDPSQASRIGYAACALLPGDMEVYEAEDLANAAFLAHSRADIVWLLALVGTLGRDRSALLPFVEWARGAGEVEDGECCWCRRNDCVGAADSTCFGWQARKLVQGWERRNHGGE